MTSKYVQDTAAAKSLSAYIVLNRKGEHVATVRAHYANSGAVLVNVHDDKAGFQHGKASGYGYDKLTAALRGLSIDGHALSDHCARDGAPKKPKGRITYPRDFKAPKGWTLANFAQVSKATGARFYRDHWQTQAAIALGFDPKQPIPADHWAACADKSDELRRAWESSDDCESGYSDCYRESGLDYLKALGYRVISAI